MLAKIWTSRSRLDYRWWRTVLFSMLANAAPLVSTSCAGVILYMEDTPLGTWVQTDTKNAIFNHQIADHNQDGFLVTQRDGTTNGNGSGKNAPAGRFIDAFNGSAADPSNPDAIYNGNKTHTILLSDIPLTTDNKYRVFLLDVNQLQSNEDTDHILIDMLEVYMSTSDSIKTLTDLTSPSLTEKIYDMSADLYHGDNFSVQIDGDNGNGKADMLFYVKNDLFTAGYGNLFQIPDPQNPIDTMNVYLRYRYSNYNDGAEEWHVTQGTYINPDPPLPEPAAMALWAVGSSIGLAWNKRRKRTKAA